MATGYTEDVAEGKLNFHQFVWRCAHGVLSFMRDSFLGARIPKEVKPELDFYEDQLAECHRRKAWLDALSDEEILEAVKETYEEDLRRRREYAEHQLKFRENYEKMLAEVQTWEPPTPEHQGLKDFMIKQLRESIDFDCTPTSIPEPVLQTPAEWRKYEEDSIARDLIYYQTKIDNESMRVQRINKWLADLRASVPQPE